MIVLQENIDCKYDPGELVTPDVTITALDKLTVVSLTDDKEG